MRKEGAKDERRMKGGGEQRRRRMGRSYPGTNSLSGRGRFGTSRFGEQDMMEVKKSLRLLLEEDTLLLSFHLEDVQLHPFIIQCVHPFSPPLLSVITFYHEGFLSVGWNCSAAE